VLLVTFYPSFQEIPLEIVTGIEYE